MSPNIVMVIVAAIVALLLLRPKVMRAPLWRATVTPLASIIGSGFLVAGPILAHAAGNWAWAAMLALCLAAYVFGGAIRHNIARVEPLLAQGSLKRHAAVLDRASEYALAFAYFVSVTYYLNLFASFALRADDIVDADLTRWLSSAAIVALGAIGAVRGLRMLEQVEATAVGIKLALIAGLLAALFLAVGFAATHGGISLSRFPHDAGLHEVGVLLGLLILVQGFETSRYLGAAYDGATRIRTMRWAQLMSAAIYFSFILLITPFFRGGLPETGGETAIIDILAPLGTMVAPLIIVAALASQLSAAVADMNGSGGLLEVATRGRVSVRIAYVATAAVALAITWSADIFEIIVYASKAFVIYYALQCALAVTVIHSEGDRRNYPRGAIYLCGAVFAVAVLFFGIPADAA